MQVSEWIRNQWGLGQNRGSSVGGRGQEEPPSSRQILGALGRQRPGGLPVTQSQVTPGSPAAPPTPGDKEAHGEGGQRLPRQLSFLPQPSLS